MEALAFLADLKGPSMPKSEEQQHHEGHIDAQPENVPCYSGDDLP
jgi:hypothetical protein